MRKWTEKIDTSAHNDPDSILVTYNQVNPNCTSDHLETFMNVLVLECITLTRYRVGAHNLEIVKGRQGFSKVDREQRLCRCNEAIQTLRYFLLDCSVLEELRREIVFNSVEEFMKWPGAAAYIIKAAKLLKIEILTIK